MDNKIFQGSECIKGNVQLVVITARNITEAAEAMGLSGYKFRQLFQKIEISELDVLRNNGWNELPPLDELEAGKRYKKSEAAINHSRNVLRERNLEEIGQIAKIECAIHQIQGCHSIKKGLDPKLRRIAGELQEILGDMREDFNDKYVGISLKK